MEYANANTVENGQLNGTDFKYHITADELKTIGNRALQARIYSDAENFDTDHTILKNVPNFDFHKRYKNTCICTLVFFQKVQNTCIFAIFQNLKYKSTNT